MINLIWFAAIVGFAVAGWMPGLLGLIAFFVLDLAIDVKHLRTAVSEWIARDMDATAGSSTAPTTEATRAPRQCYVPSALDRAFAEVCDRFGAAVHAVDTTHGRQAYREGKP